MGKINKYCNIYDIEGNLITHVDKNGILPNQYKIALAKMEEYAKQKEAEKHNDVEEATEKLQEVVEELNKPKEIEMDKYIEFEESKAA